MVEQQDKIRVEVGFTSGHAVAGRIDKEAYAKLRSEVKNGSGWHDLELEEGPITLNLAEVIYVRSDAEEGSIGFSGN